MRYDGSRKRKHDETRLSSNEGSLEIRSASLEKLDATHVKWSWYLGQNVLHHVWLHVKITACAVLLIVLNNWTWFFCLSLSAESKNELSLYAKNYLPILFNLYTAEEKEGDPDRLPILETVRVYLSITDHKVSTLPSLWFTVRKLQVCDTKTFRGNSSVHVSSLVLRLQRILWQVKKMSSPQ